MAKVITFSTTFPSYHPKAGQPTYFVEKFWESIYLEYIGWESFVDLKDRGFNIGLHNMFEPMHHTIRKGNRFNVGDKFSPRIWGNDINPKNGKSGPYQSKQIIIGPDIEIKNVWDFSKDLISKDFYLNGIRLQEPHFIHAIASNDGLSLDDLLAWFKYPKPFTGQIICWNENINY